LKSDETIGDVLLENISLTDAQKTQLLLSDIKMKKEENSSRSHKEKQKQFNYISSLVFYQILDFDRLSKEISEFDSELSIFFAKKGHPLTCLIKDVKTNKIDLNIDGLKEINSNGILNQLFWTELSERDDFEIVRNASIDSDYVYYDHPILEHQLNITEEFGGTENFSLGGGVMLTHADYEASWLIFNDENFFYMDGLVAHSILTFDENSITPIIQETKETYNLGAVLLSLVLNEWTVRYQDEEDIYIVDKYGFKTSCEGVEIERWLFTFAWQHEERADFDYFSATAKLNPDYNGKLSWRNLPIEKQKAIFDLLSLGLQEPDSKLRNDAIHFLGCMALHEDTPQELLNQLGNLNIPLVADSLNSR
jgi:hypothetical protein